MPHRLPPEITSLIHYLHLNEAGWWERGIRELITSIVWLNGTETRNGVRQALQNQCLIQLDRTVVDRHIDHLITVGTLIELPSGQVKITEAKLPELERQLKETEQRERDVIEVFGKLLSKHCTQLDAEQTWTSFKDRLLFPLIEEMGAQTFELISGTAKKRLEGTKTFTDFLEGFSDEIQVPLRTTIADFFDPKNLEVRAYVLNQLNTHFFLQAGISASLQFKLF